MSTELKSINYNPAELAGKIKLAWEAYIIQEERRSAPSKRPYPYAGSHEECLRKMVLFMTDGDKVAPFEPEVLAKFHRGNDRARNLKIDLSRVGQLCRPSFEVIGQEERFELRDHKGRVAIVGKVDCRLQFDRITKSPVEIKDWSENITARLSTFEDCFQNRWTKKGAYQLLCYLYGAGEPFGFLLLGKSGLPALLPVRLDDHLDRVEEFLQKAELALDYREAGTLPEFINDPEECKRCAFFGSVCQPPTSYPGATILTDPELEALLDRRAELEERAEEYERIDKQVKSSLRGVEQGIAGQFHIVGKWGAMTKTVWPDEATKKKYQVKDPKGKFTTTITKL